MRSHLYVFVNTSADPILDSSIVSPFEGVPRERVTLQVTEHAAVERYRQVKAALASLREEGMQLAVGDAGAGFSSLRHILELAPDRMKLDCSLTRNVHCDPARTAGCFCPFCERYPDRLSAEGVETETELGALQDLGVEKAQGYYLGHPMPLQQVIEAVRLM